MSNKSLPRDQSCNKPRAKYSRLALPREEYKKLTRDVFERDKWKCRVCSSRNNLHCHHIVFRSHNGDDASWNLLTVCSYCHDSIHKRYVVILSKNEDDEFIDADAGIKLIFVNGWIPYGKRRIK